MFHFLLKWLKNMSSTSKTKKTICIDPGHGMSNIRSGVYDPGAIINKFYPDNTEANIVLKWGIELEKQLKNDGYTVILTRRDIKTPTPLLKRTKMATDNKADLLISLHTNAFNGKASGAETFYRSSISGKIAKLVNDNYCAAVSLINRGAKNESDTKRGRIHVLSYKESILIELGFIDNLNDHKIITNPEFIKIGCESIVRSLNLYYGL